MNIISAKPKLDGMRWEDYKRGQAKAAATMIRNTQHGQWGERSFEAALKYHELWVIKVMQWRSALELQSLRARFVAANPRRLGGGFTQFAGRLDTRQTRGRPSTRYEDGILFARQQRDVLKAKPWLRNRT